MKRDPSQRKSSRYIRFKVHSEEKKEFGEIVNEVWDELLDYIGSLGTSEADPWIIKNKFDYKSQEGVIAVSSSAQQKALAALNFVDEIGGEKAAINVEEVSGTIKTLN